MRLLSLVTLVVCLAVDAVAGARPLISRSEAGRIARSSQLKASDAPADYKSSASSNGPGEDIWGGRRYARCASRKAYGKDIADVLSPSFERGANGQFDAVGSEVEVMPKESLAANDIAIAKSTLG